MKKRNIDYNDLFFGGLILLVAVFIIVAGILSAVGVIEIPVSPTVAPPTPPIPGYSLECSEVEKKDRRYNFFEERWESDKVIERTCIWLPPTPTPCPSTYDLCGEN